MRVLLVGDGFSPTAYSEPFSSFKTAEALSSQVDLTVLCSAPNSDFGHQLSASLPLARVIPLICPPMKILPPRIRAAVRPNYPVFFYKARQWILEAIKRGEKFEIAHQITPQAIRYPSPLLDTGIRYVLGPVGGSLRTPESMRNEINRSDGFIQLLRHLDTPRFRFDPWLRLTYSNSDLVLGVAPYVEDLLAPLKINRFQVVTEPGADCTFGSSNRRIDHSFILLHVGRTVRSKGLRECIRALHYLRDLTDVRLVSIGDGPDIAACKSEVNQLGLSSRVDFKGALPREDVIRWYEKAHVFFFPSFREPAGNVIVEAMSYGLPVVTLAYGGPDYLVGENEGIKVNLEDVKELPLSLSQAIRTLYASPGLRSRLGENAQRRVRNEYLWTKKAEKIASLYRQLLI